MTSTRTAQPGFSMRIAGLVALALAAMLVIASGAHAATYDPLKAITNDNMRDYKSMSEKQIQAFLETKAGPLKSIRTNDYAGVERSAAGIIYRASQQWKINPKVIIATLQKEQSLIDAPTTRYSLKYRLDNAMGAGVYDHDGDGKVDRIWPSFGGQVWNAARLFDKYGEPYDTYLSRREWATRGIKIYDYDLKKKVTIYPKNVATFKLYVYTPYSSGPKTTATIYSRYFGSPLASVRYRKVSRFRNKVNGTYLYTASPAETVRLRSASGAKRWAYSGVAFTVDTAVPTTQTIPVYRFKNKKSGIYSFTDSGRLRDSRRSAAGRKTWQYDGVAFRVSRKGSDGAVSVWRFQNKRTKAFLYTASAKEKASLRSAKNRKAWTYKGRAFYLPQAATVAPTP